MLDRDALLIRVRQAQLEARTHGVGPAVLLVTVDDKSSVRQAGITSAVGLGLRETDSCGLWGKDQFLVVLPQTDTDGAMVVAERITSKLGQTLQQTLSIGIASGQTPMDLPKMATVALYEAQRNGGARIQLFTPQPTDFKA